MKIKFNDVFKSTDYLNFVSDLFSDYNHFRSKKYSKLALSILQKRFESSSLWLTHSATGALEMIAKAIDIQKGDEIIMPSFTFVSTANAFVSHGATPVFVDIEPETLNLNLQLVEKAISPKTRAIVAVHYAGHSCDLNELLTICKKHNILLIEDAAMAFGNTFKGQPLGTIGDFGVISFDITKQISAIQGGLLICNQTKYAQKLDHIYHIGTDRTQFMDKGKPYYEWVDVGSKYQLNELNAVALYDQLLHEEEILRKRKEISAIYWNELNELRQHNVQLISEDRIQSNIHLFYLILNSNSEQEDFINYLNEREIESLFHYIPLHSSEMGKKFNPDNLPVTEEISSRLVRLPLHINLSVEDLQHICSTVKNYWK